MSGQSLYDKRRIQARKRAQRLKEKLCVDCGKHPAVPDRQRCEDCGQAASKRNVARLQRYKGPRLALKLCIRCGNIAMPGRQKCGVCSEQSAVYKKNLRDRYRAEGKCSRCGHEKDQPELAMCRDCRTWHSARDRKRKKGSGDSPGAEP